MEAMERAAKTATIGNIFADDPIFKARQRDRKGRFATAERAAYDRANRENSFLKFQVEKYKRLAEGAQPTISALNQIVRQQSETIVRLRKELAQKRKNNAK